MSNKIVYNGKFGGFGLSKAARKYLVGLGIPEDTYDDDIARHDPRLVQVVEKLGKYADGLSARLKIEDIGDETRYIVDEYDGLECVVTPTIGNWITIEKNF